MNRLAQRELPKSQTPSYCKFMPDARRKNNPNTRSCLLLMSFASDGQFVFTENGCFHPLMWALFDDANRCRERGSDACCRESDYTELLYQLTTTTLLPPKGAIVQVGSKFDVRPSSVVCLSVCPSRFFPMQQSTFYCPPLFDQLKSFQG